MSYVALCVECHGGFLNAENIVNRNKKYWLYLACAMLWAFTLLLWIMLWFSNPYVKLELKDLVTAPGMLIVVLSGTGIFVAIKEKTAFLVLISVGSFLPVGWYFLGSPGIFKLIGLFNLLNAVLSIILFYMERFSKRNAVSK